MSNVVILVDGKYLGISVAGTALPSVTTTAISTIGETTATGGGTVTSEGSSSVTVRGICWNLTGTPTTANNKTTDGSGSGAFVSSMTGLASGTLYYVRAYATSAVGTSYGIQTSFSTVSTTSFLSPGTGFIADWSSQQIGVNGNPGGNETCIARCVFRRYRDVDDLDAGLFYFGLIADHYNDIDRVEASIENGVRGSTNALTLNPRTGHYEYTFSIDPTEFTLGMSEVRFEVFPKNDGFTRIVISNLYVDPTAAYTRSVRYLDYTSGSDTYDGTAEVHGVGLIGPWKTHGYTQANAPDGALVYLVGPSTMSASASGFVNNVRPIEFRPNIGSSATDVLVTVGGADFRTRRLAYNGIAFKHVGASPWSFWTNVLLTSSRNLSFSSCQWSNLCNVAINFAGQPSDGDTAQVIIDAWSKDITFEFDNNASVTAGNVAVTIGGTLADTLTNFISAINLSALGNIATLTDADTVTVANVITVDVTGANLSEDSSDPNTNWAFASSAADSFSEEQPYLENCVLNGTYFRTYGIGSLVDCQLTNIRESLISNPRLVFHCTCNMINTRSTFHVSTLIFTNTEVSNALIWNVKFLRASIIGLEVDPSVTPPYTISDISLRNVLLHIKEVDSSDHNYLGKTTFSETVRHVLMRYITTNRRWFFVAADPGETDTWTSVRLQHMVCYEYFSCPDDGDITLTDIASPTNLWGSQSQTNVTYAALTAGWKANARVTSDSFSNLFTDYANLNFIPVSADLVGKVSGNTWPEDVIGNPRGATTATGAFAAAGE